MLKDSRTAYIVITIIICSLIPLGLALVYRHNKKPMRPLYIGILGFFAFPYIAERFVHMIILGINHPLNRFLSADNMRLVIYGALMAGFFEELGRWIIFDKCMEMDRTGIVPVGYGIGHGGIEVFVNVVFPLITMAPLVFGPSEFLLWSSERAFAVCGHIALSVIVYLGWAKGKKAFLFLAAILHAAADLPVGMYKYGFWSMGKGDVFFDIFVIIIVIIALIIYKNQKTDRV